MDEPITTLSIAGMLAAAAVGYLLGSVSFALILSKLRFKKDIRKFGSGNAGASNMMRNYGWQYGVLTFIGDAGKGVLACWLGLLIGGEVGKYIGALFVIVGHIYPVFMRFRGGKGVSTAAGVAFFLAPGCAAVSFALAIGTMALTRMVSLGSIVGLVLIAVAAWIFYPGELMFQLLMTVIALLCIYAHRANILRIIKGTESRMSFKRGKKSAAAAVTAEAQVQPSEDTVKDERR